MQRHLATHDSYHSDPMAKVALKVDLQSHYVFTAMYLGKIAAPPAPPGPPDGGGSGERNNDGSETPRVHKHAKMLLRD